MPGTGLSGPFREIVDQELRIIFYLIPATANLLGVIPITSRPPPGANDQRVTKLLRRMLYVRMIQPKELEILAQSVRELQSDRQMIAISAKLISLMRDAFERPWAFPALLDTKDIFILRSAFSNIANATGVFPDVSSATPVALALSKLSFAGSAFVSHTAYTLSLTKEYYAAYLQRMNSELMLRGVNTNLIP